MTYLVSTLGQNRLEKVSDWSWNYPAVGDLRAFLPLSQIRATETNRASVWLQGHQPSQCGRRQVTEDLIPPTS